MVGLSAIPCAMKESPYRINIMLNLYDAVQCGVSGNDVSVRPCSVE